MTLIQEKNDSDRIDRYNQDKNGSDIINPYKQKSIKIKDNQKISNDIQVKYM